MEVSQLPRFALYYMCQTFPEGFFFWVTFPETIEHGLLLFFLWTELNVWSYWLHLTGLSLTRQHIHTHTHTYTGLYQLLLNVANGEDIFAKPNLVCQTICIKGDGDILNPSSTSQSQLRFLICSIVVCFCSTDSFRNFILCCWFLLDCFVTLRVIS